MRKEEDIFFWFSLTDAIVLEAAFTSVHGDTRSTHLRVAWATAHLLDVACARLQDEADRAEMWRALAC